MENLTTVYERNVGPVQSLERLYVGTALFLAGTAFMLGAIIGASTDLLVALFGMEEWQAWEIAGILGGVGLPMIFLGLVSVLPLDDHTETRIKQGSLITFAGIVLFLYVYPYHWNVPEQDYTVYVLLTYATGLGMTLFYAFRTLATYNPRTDVVVNHTPRDGESSDTDDTPSFGSGAGLATDTPPEDDPRYNTDTDDGLLIDQEYTENGEILSDSEDDDDMNPDVDAAVDAPGDSPYHDKYCGSCEHFEYRDGVGGMVPHCGLHDENMDDLDACEDWSGNTQ